MKLSFMLIVALLQCEVMALFPVTIIGYLPKQEAITKHSDPRFDRKENSYYYDYNKNSTLILTLYDGFKYKIIISKHATENFDEFTVSFGSFSINRDKSYSFSDVPTGIEFSAYKSGDSLKFARGWTLMQGVTDEGFGYDLDQQCYLEDLAETQRFEQRDSYPSVNSGVYVYNPDSFADSFVMLNLKPDHVFEFHVLDVPISSGRWRQYNAEIILSDSCLNKELKLIVDNKQLICSFMPGNLIGTELYLKEPVKNQPTSAKRNTNRALMPIGLIVLISLGSWIVIYLKRKTRQTTHH